MLAQNLVRQASLMPWRGPHAAGGHKVPQISSHMHPAASPGFSPLPSHAANIALVPAASSDAARQAYPGQKLDAIAHIAVHSPTVPQVLHGDDLLSNKKLSKRALSNCEC